MPDEFAHAQCPLVLYPEAMTYGRAQGIIAHNAERTAIKITEGRVSFPGLAGREMQGTFPRFQDQCDLPADGRALDTCCRLPNRGRDIADKEVPGQRVQMRC
jgi:hypothetical protein